AWWRARLGVQQTVRTERISRFQVTGAAGRPGESMVGVSRDAGAATIYHTRALTAEDGVHELLHVAHPDWSEGRVVEETTLLLAAFPGGQLPARGPTRRRRRRPA